MGVQNPPLALSTSSLHVFFKIIFKKGRNRPTGSQKLRRFHY